MKSIIQKSLLIALLYYTTILIGCIKNQCKCPIPQKGKYTFTQIAANNLAYNFSGDSSFSTTNFSGDTISKEELGIRFQFDYNTVFQLKKDFPSFALVNAAYACSCAENEFTLKDTIKSIVINTIFDFDATHLAGSDVTDYFSTVYQSYAPKNIVFESAFANGYYDFYQQYTSAGRIAYDLYLKKKVTTSRIVAFELQIEYTNGTSMSATTKPIFIR